MASLSCLRVLELDWGAAYALFNHYCYQNTARVLSSMADSMQILRQRGCLVAL